MREFKVIYGDKVIDDDKLSVMVEILLQAEEKFEQAEIKKQ